MEKKENSVYDAKLELMELCDCLSDEIRKSNYGYNDDQEEKILQISHDVYMMAKNIKVKADKKHQDMLDETVHNMYDWA